LPLFVGAAYASALGQELTEEWKRLGLVSVLELNRRMFRPAPGLGGLWDFS